MAWRKAKDGLKELLPSDVYSLWIKPLEFVRQEGQSVVLSAPDRYFIAFVKKNYTKDILSYYGDQYCCKE